MKIAHNEISMDFNQKIFYSLIKLNFLLYYVCINNDKTNNIINLKSINKSFQPDPRLLLLNYINLNFLKKKLVLQNNY